MCPTRYANFIPWRRPLWRRRGIGDRGSKGRGTLDLDQLAPPAIDAHRAELPTPDAAGVERDQVGPADQPQRGPVAERDRRALRAPLRGLEPGRETGGGGV